MIKFGRIFATSKFGSLDLLCNPISVFERSFVLILKNCLFVAKNALRAALLLICVSIVCFFLVSFSPIDPLQVNVGQTALGSMSSEQIQKLETYWGVGTPATERFLYWASDFLRGDMGVSLLYRQNVFDILITKLSYSLPLLIIAWTLSGAFGFLLGVISGVNRGKFIDKLIRTYCIVISSTPTFWIGLVLLLVFAVQLNILPIGLGVPIGIESSNVTIWNRLHHAILPAFTLSITGISHIALHTREKIIDVMQSDYVLFAKARGESHWDIIKNHALRNTLLPAITLHFASISEILGGSILIEQVFSYPGLGQAAVRAGLGSDIPLLLAITIISTSIVFIGNFTANTLYTVIDPRVGGGSDKL